MELSDLILDPLHLIIHVDDSSGAVEKFITDFFISIHFFDILLITKLMLQCGPEIHAVGTDLDLGSHRCFSFGEKYGDFYDHVIAAVAVGLWIFDVIFYLDNSDIVLLGDQIRNGVDIIDKSAHNPDAGYIIQLILDILGCKFIAKLLKLLVNAFWFFDPGFDKRNGITFIFHGKFIVEDFQLGTDLPDSTAVHHHQVVKFCGIFDKNPGIRCIQPGIGIFFCHGIF